jgi:anthranilate synthase component 1
MHICTSGFVDKLQTHIVGGDIIQAVPSQRLTVSLPSDVTPFDLYRQLRVVNPSPYMYYVEMEDTHIVGASPEMLVKVDENKVMKIS